VRIGLKKKSGKEDLKTSSFWSSIWRKKSRVESTVPSNNGKEYSGCAGSVTSYIIDYTDSSRGNKGIVKALSSIFKRRTDSKHSASHEKGEVSYNPIDG